MKTNKFIFTGLLAGALVIGGSTASAFYPGTFSLEAFTDFTSAQQTAIEEAFTIREEAEEEAQAVLEAAGVDEESLREAMHAYREEQHEKLEAALEAGDYDAYLELVAGTPLEENLTEEIFDQLVEAYELREAGDHERARAIMDELRDEGVMAGFRFGKGHRGFGGPRDAASDTDTTATE